MTWLIRGLLGCVGLGLKTLTKAVPFSNANFLVRPQSNSSFQKTGESTEELESLLNKPAETTDEIFKDGVLWTKLPPEESSFHGKDCAKYVEPSGRELVINKNGYLELNRSTIGTYNFVAFGFFLNKEETKRHKGFIRSIGHGALDVIPYVIYGNSFEDSTDLFIRISNCIPKTD